MLSVVHNFTIPCLSLIQVSLKRHRWHRKVLKTKDPIVVSIGWRRFQTTPVYAIEDRNGRHRMLKYTPEHMHCFAMFWGPLAPPKSGVLAVQSLSSNKVRSVRSSHHSIDGKYEKENITLPQTSALVRLIILLQHMESTLTCGYSHPKPVLGFF